jgi:hypothetical protein
MIKTVSYTYDSTGATPNFTNEWRDFNVADFENVAITIQSSTGWTGDITFWGAAGYLDAAPATQAYLYSVHDASETDNTVYVNTLTNGGANYGKTFTAPIAGLTRFGIFMADAVTYNAAIGFIEVAISFQRSDK